MPGRAQTFRLRNVNESAKNAAMKPIPKNTSVACPHPWFRVGKRVKVYGRVANLLLSMGLSGLSLAAADNEPILVGTDKQLFIDQRFLETKQGVAVVVNSPRLTREKLIVADKPWERSWLGGYTSVIQEGELIRLWYEVNDSGKDGVGNGVAYAFSKDGGATWVKPSLGIVEYKASKDNNLVHLGGHGYTVFKNRPNASRSEQYCMFIGTPSKANQAMVSADGFNWVPTGKVPFLDPDINERLTLDSQNVAFWDTRINKYVIYPRHNLKHEDGAQGVNRVFKYAASATWGNFGQHQMSFQKDARDPLDFDWYTTGVIQYPYAADAYFMWPAAYHHYPEPPVGKYRNDGPLDLQFAVSRDGIQWARPDRRAVIRLGMEGEWDRGSIYAGYGLSRSGNELSLYYTAYIPTHGAYVETGVLGGVITRAIYRLDGFMSVDAPYEGGEFTTPAIIFNGSRLELNFDGSAGGWTKVEIVDGQGRPIPGYSAGEADNVTGNGVVKTVTWAGKSDVSLLKGRPIKLRFVMRDAKLYAFQFVR